MARLPRLLARHRMRLEAERVGDLFQRRHVLFRIATGEQRPIARGRPTDLVFQTERAAHPGHPALVHRVASRRVLPFRSEEHTSELQSLMRISYAVFCLKKKKEHTELQKPHVKTDQYNQ